MRILTTHCVNSRIEHDLQNTTVFNCQMNNVHIGVMNLGGELWEIIKTVK